MEDHAVVEPGFKVEEGLVAVPLVKVKEKVVTRPSTAGVVYGEIVFWVMVASIVISVAGLIVYLRAGGYFDSANLLSHLWAGCDCLTIWKEVGNVSQPLPWYSCLGMLSRGDMLAVLGLVVTGSAGILGVWGAFLVLAHGKSGIFAVFAFVIAAVLTLSALGILEF